ncbi:four helix bundle protein [bacterium]|nr:four helix bundle protein [bacterium]
MDKEKLKLRTKQFAFRVIKLTEALPQKQSGLVIGKQLIRSGTSVGANYRSACYGRSKAEFIAKMGIALEEADESAYWMELIIEAELLSKNQVESLLKEANELAAILYASIKTARKNKA